LVDWANATFKADLSVSRIEKLSRKEVIALLEAAAHQRIDEIDLAPVDQFLVKNYGAQKLAEWASNKFAGEYKTDDFAGVENVELASQRLMQKAREAYNRRERVYPIDFALEMTRAGLQHNPQQALTQFCGWVKARYELDWKPDALPSANPGELRKLLIEEAENWDEARIADRAERAVNAAGTTPESLDQWLQQNMGERFTPEERERAVDDPKSVMEEKIGSVLRAELAQFERWVLLQILDQAWKDHLHSMDQLKESIGLRSFSQKDPRIEFKREGARLFEEMHVLIRDKVTDLIFKAKLTPQAAPVAQRPPQQAPAAAMGTGGATTVAGAQPNMTQRISAGGPSPSGGTASGPHQPVAPRAAQPAIAAASAATQGTAQQRRDLEIAEQAGGPESGSRQAPKRRPVKAVATVGRNEPCPCGSGKKYKQCCGKKG